MTDRDVDDIRRRADALTEAIQAHPERMSKVRAPAADLFRTIDAALATETN
ncbi:MULTISPECIES: hypothetical protein [unclassified Microbacterium]|uniref:hypothetical protein n=1 Tax=unclassified Microbacterium TaxID=2609290 RepID=UPI00136DD747|nr:MULTISPECIES: hypothetical protein [unclassified Microbacterium]